MNLIISFALGRSMGMTGILLGTSATYLIQFILKVMLFYKKCLKRSYAEIFLKNAAFAILTAAECTVICLCTSAIGAAVSNRYATFIIYAAVSGIIPLVINSLVFIKTEEFKYTLNLCCETLKRFGSAK